MATRLICLTDFKLDKKFWENYYESNTDIRTIYAGLETCPTTQRPHWQMFIYYNKKIRFSNKLRESFEGRSMRMCNGSLEQNIKYCSKESFAWMLGTLPKQGRRTDLEDIRQEIKAGKPEIEIAENHFSQWCFHRRSFEAYRLLVEPKRSEPSEVHVLWGKSGTGKSRKAFADGAVPLCYHNGAIGGYNGEPIVVFDDFDWKLFNLTDVLKWTDRHACTIPVKGGFRNWAPKKIYITANTDPFEWWKFADPEQLVGWRRRIKVEHFDVPNVPEVIEGNTKPL